VTAGSSDGSGYPNFFLAVIDGFSASDVMYYSIRQFVVESELARPWQEPPSNFNTSDGRLDIAVSAACYAFGRSWPEMLFFDDICHLIAYPPNHPFTATTPELPSINQVRLLE
jgi:hypothetical protein